MYVIDYKLVFYLLKTQPKIAIPQPASSFPRDLVNSMLLVNVPAWVRVTVGLLRNDQRVDGYGVVGRLR